jgi:hypothetical protein
MESLTDIFVQLPYFNNFALDPHHIQPYSHLPPSGGAGQQAPPQAYGLLGPPPMPPADYMRGANGGIFYPAPYPPGGFPPSMNMPQHWDPYAYSHMSNMALAPRRDDSASARRLSDRISGYAPGSDYPIDSPTTIPASAGLPAKPPVSMDQPLSDETRVRRAGSSRRNTRSGEPGGPPPPPPPDAKEDPRAAAGKKVSYHDMDLVAEGDVELQY